MDSSTSLLGEKIRSIECQDIQSLNYSQCFEVLNLGTDMIIIFPVVLFLFMLGIIITSVCKD